MKSPSGMPLLIILSCIFLISSIAHSRPIRVASFNVFDGVGTVGSSEYNAISNILQRIDADIVAFQELMIVDKPNWENLAIDLGYGHTAFGIATPFSGELYNGYFSKYPIIDTYNVVSPPGANETTRPPFHAVIDVPGAANPLALWAIHHKAIGGASNEFRRAVEAQRCAEHINEYLSLKADTQEYIVLGGFNDDVGESQTASFSSIPADVPASYSLGADITFPVSYATFPVDAYDSAGNGLVMLDATHEDSTNRHTFISGGRLDYIFVSSNLWSSSLGLPVSEIYNSAADDGIGGMPKSGSPLPASTSTNASDHYLIFADVQMADGFATSNMVAWLRFEGDFDDTTTNNNHGTPSSVTLVDGAPLGRLGQVASFTGGAGSYVTLPHIPFDIRPFAVSFYFKLRSPTNSGFIMQEAGPGSYELLHLQLRSERRPYFGFYGDDYLSSPSVNDTNWHHVVFQYNGTAKEVWFDGEFRGQDTSPAYQGSSGATYLGRTPNWAGVDVSNLNGYMDDFRIYHRTLNSNEIQYLSGGASCTNIVTSPNMVRNGSFEAAGSTSGVAAHWNMGDPDNQGNYWGNASRENWRARTGGWMGTIKTIWGGTGENFGGFWQGHFVTGGVHYALGGWFYADPWWGANRQVMIGRYYAPGNVHLLSITNDLGSIDDEWTYRSFVSQAPTGANYCVVSVEAEGAGPGGALQFDDLHLRPVTHAGSITHSGGNTGRVAFLFSSDTSCSQLQATEQSIADSISSFHLSGIAPLPCQDLDVFMDIDGNGVRSDWEAAQFIPCVDATDFSMDIQLVDPDGDGDGVTDYAEIFIYQSDPGSSDSDTDGVPDYEEVIAGTSLTNEHDYLRVMSEALSATNSGIVDISWSSTSGRLYTVWQRADLMLSSNQALGIVSSTPPVNTFSVPASNITEHSVFSVGAEYPD